METREEIVSYVIEDFAPGDRVYHVNSSGGNQMGRVKKTAIKYVLITMDDRTEKRVHLSSFVKKHNAKWGKALDLEAVSVGDRISLGGYGRQRMFATVLSYIPREEMTVDIELHDNRGIQHSPQTYTQTSNMTLEWWFAKWEMEG